jgi:hypothetical protein
MAQKTKAKKSRQPAAKKAKRPANGTATASEPSMKQQLLDSLAREHAKTLKVLRAFPADQSEFRPHPRSKNARELAWTFVMEQGVITRAINDQLNFSGGSGSSAPPVPNDFSGIVAQFERDYQGLVDLIKKTPEAAFRSRIKVPTGPGQMGDWSKLGFAWFIIADQIHHRGQLTVYVRMAGGKVPAIYGPSADETWR